jgi:hypothetical protein
MISDYVFYILKMWLDYLKKFLGNLPGHANAGRGDNKRMIIPNFILVLKSRQNSNLLKRLNIKCNS